MRMCHFRVQNGPFVLNKIFLVQTIIISFILPLFIEQNFKKILTADPELCECTIFGPKMVNLGQVIFFGKLLISFSSTYQPLSLCKFEKNSSSRSIVMRMHNFWAQNDQFPQIKFCLENLLMSLVSFIHAYLHAKNQSQMLIYQ